MLPVAILPICGILMGIGYWLCPATMQGGDIHGAANLIGLFLVKAGGALIDNMALLFLQSVSVSVCLKKMMVQVVSSALASMAYDDNTSFNRICYNDHAFYRRQCNKDTCLRQNRKPVYRYSCRYHRSVCYNKFKSTKLPGLVFFLQWKTLRSNYCRSCFYSCICCFFVWPLLFGGLCSWKGRSIVGLDIGAGIYAFLNRLLIPTGLHHALNNVFWFDTIGLGDLQHFWAGETSADVSWSLGMYMSGFFPCMMFGIPGAALAMVKCAKPAKKKLQSDL